MSQKMQNNQHDKSLIIRLLLNDCDGTMYPDVFIDKLMDTFTIPEILFVILILNNMKIDFKKIKKFINIMNETTIGSNEPEEPANQQ